MLPVYSQVPRTFDPQKAEKGGQGNFLKQGVGGEAPEKILVIFDIILRMLQSIFIREKKRKRGGQDGGQMFAALNCS